ncbi:hypothetical protein [Halobellus limi]|nr:hypothetical protein [Halobellus limi]
MTPPANQYEISIYRVFPWYFWTMLVASTVVGQVLILRGAFPDEKPGRDWQLGLLLILLCNSILVFVPYVRGYTYFERADVLTHLGFIQIIQRTGRFSGELIYPNIHQLVLTLSYATGLEPMRVINAVSGVISLFSMLAAIALVATVYDRRRALFSIPFVCLLIGGTAHMNASPFAQSMLILPFVLYLFVKEQQTHAFAIRLALAVSLVALVIYHPLTALFALVFFTIYAVFQTSVVRGALLSSDAASSALTGSGTVRRLTLGAFVVWYYNFAGMLIRAESVLNTLFGASNGESQLDAYSSTVSRTSPAVVDLLRILLLEYGISMILLGVSGLHFSKMLVKRARRRLSVSVFELSFSATAMAFAGVSVLFLLFDLIVGFGRPLMAARYFAVLVVGSFFFDLYERLNWDPNVPRAVVVVLTILVVLSTLGAHHSPLTMRTNQQVTDMELDGAGWHLTYSDMDRPHAEYGVDLYRFEDALIGFHSDNVTKDPDPPPDHFGYADGETLGAEYNESHYLVITSAGRQFYPEVWPDYRQFWRYTAEDFDRLETDPTVAQVYANGGYDTYLVNETITPA